MNTRTISARRRRPRVPILTPVYVVFLARQWRDEVAGR